MLVTEWLSPEYGLTVNVKQLTWATDAVDTYAALDADTEGRLLVVTAEDVRIAWSPVTYADFSAIEAVIDQPSFGNVYDGITEEADRRDNTDDDEQTVEEMLDQLEELDDILDFPDQPSPSDRPRPWGDDPQPDDDDTPDRWGPHWQITTATVGQTRHYQVQQPQQPTEERALDTAGQETDIARDDTDTTTSQEAVVTSTSDDDLDDVIERFLNEDEVVNDLFQS